MCVLDCETGLNTQIGQNKSLVAVSRELYRRAYFRFFLVNQSLRNRSYDLEELQPEDISSLANALFKKKDIDSSRHIYFSYTWNFLLMLKPNLSQDAELTSIYLSNFKWLKSLAPPRRQESGVTLCHLLDGSRMLCEIDLDGSFGRGSKNEYFRDDVARDKIFVQEHDIGRTKLNSSRISNFWSEVRKMRIAYEADLQRRTIGNMNEVTTTFCLGERLICADVEGYAPGVTYRDLFSYSIRPWCCLLRTEEFQRVEHTEKIDMGKRPYIVSELIGSKVDKFGVGASWELGCRCQTYNQNAESTTAYPLSVFICPVHSGIDA
jgi:hypothetical protein